MNRILLILGLILCVALGIYLVENVRNAYKVLPIDTSAPEAADAYEQWFPFETQEGGFAVELPVPPQNAKQSIPIPDAAGLRAYDMYVSETLDGTIYMISTITYPSESIKKTQARMLQEMIHEMVETHPKNSLEKIQETVFAGFPAIEYNIKNEEIHIEGVVFMEDNRLFILNTIARAANFDMEAYHHFIDSFRLLNGAKMQNGKPSQPVRGVS